MARAAISSFKLGFPDPAVASLLGTSNHPMDMVRWCDKEAISIH
jgi:hypothetical protein